MNIFTASFVSIVSLLCSFLGGVVDARVALHTRNLKDLSSGPKATLNGFLDFSSFSQLRQEATYEGISSPICVNNLLLSNLITGISETTPFSTTITESAP